MAPRDSEQTLQGSRLRMQGSLGWADTLVRFRVQGLGSIDPSFRALAGRLKFKVRHHYFNNDSLFECGSW